MYKLDKLKTWELDKYNLLISDLKSIVGGLKPTEVNTPGWPRHGADAIDQCSGFTTFANGSELNDTINS